MARDGKRPVKQEPYVPANDSSEEEEREEDHKVPNGRRQSAADDIPTMTAADWKRKVDEEVEQTIPGALRLCLSNAKKQKHDLLKHTFEGVNATGNAVTLAKELSDKSQLDALENISKDFAHLHGQIGAYEAKVSALEQKLQGSQMPSSFDGALDVSSFRLPAKELAQHDYVKQFYAAAGIELEGDDDEVMVQENNSMRNNTCPITQMIMEEPMKNPACGHTYSRKGIESHLKLKQSCPIAGCRQRVENLERDVEMEVILSRKKRHGGRSFGGTNVDSDDDDDDDEAEHVVA
ncbi:Aste57867_14887 [Aphanomyces stellatus]|uniref:Aste57867_14887 protein n=1 Tax=Aphanomyces stellatus TaxID=120398 RepID=A0A485L1V2_9STRA|nr:hypothetical protein As57867_014831 [Aphanomyces stellatus]VFT91704.1 Aste57867_14887 [Aphanomyces stellatus]